jgi:Glutamate-cysteine ligase.
MKFAQEEAQKIGVELDENLLRHLGFLFIRDPLVIFPDRVYVDDTKNTNHFEVFFKIRINIFRAFKVQTGMMSDLSLLQVLIQM